MKHAMQHRGLVVWFTGLSGAGKSTLCRALAYRLREQGNFVMVLDGDDLRRNLHADLGFSRADREENVRRIAVLAETFADQDIIVLVAAIAPYRSMRDAARRRLSGFVEVYVNASLETCMRRDTKGLYQRALAGEIKGFTGIDDPYEEPLSPEVECRTDSEGVNQGVEKILAVIQNAVAWQSARAV